jgi:hypothetical protein
VSFLALVCSGEGVGLEIAHSAGPLGSVLVLLGILGYSFVVFRQVMRRNHEEPAEHASDSRVRVRRGRAWFSPR